ncbi:MAG: symmetrical bis(5'-nucleosyl)-tetraphosphatase [Psittacicella sp.]
MSTYIVGDIHGNFTKLKYLLEKINFNPEKDMLYSVGDIIARGEESLQVVRFLRSLGSSFDMVLGNHEVNLMAIYYGFRKPSKKDFLEEIINSDQFEEIIDFFKSKRFIIERRDLNFIITHAGLFPKWSIEDALKYSDILHNKLNSQDVKHFLESVYKKDLLESQSEVFYLDAFTRMRYCYKEDDLIKLDLAYKGEIKDAPKSLKPWFYFSKRDLSIKLFFGHWASLGIENSYPPYYATDAGCAWGGDLYIYSVDENKYIHS